MVKRNKIADYKIDPAFSRGQYELDKEMIARGNSPYNPELLIGVDEYKEGEEITAPRRNKGNYMSREEASRMMHDFALTKPYLKSIIGKYANPKLADSLDWSGLLREAYKIKGIAKKILGDKPVNVDEASAFVKKLLRGK